MRTVRNYDIFLRIDFSNEVYSNNQKASLWIITASCWRIGDVANFFWNSRLLLSKSIKDSQHLSRALLFFLLVIVIK